MSRARSRAKSDDGNTGGGKKNKSIFIIQFFNPSLAAFQRVNTDQSTSRLAASFLSPNRNASQVQLRPVSSLFRHANNRNQIRISVREMTAAVRFTVHRPTGSEFPFLQRPAFLCPERQLHCHSGRAVQRSVNQRIFFASH